MLTSSKMTSQAVALGNDVGTELMPAKTMPTRPRQVVMGKTEARHAAEEDDDDDDDDDEDDNDKL